MKLKLIRYIISVKNYVKNSCYPCSNKQSFLFCFKMSNKAYMFERYIVVSDVYYL